MVWMPAAALPRPWGVRKQALDGSKAVLINATIMLLLCAKGTRLPRDIRTRASQGLLSSSD